MNNIKRRSSAKKPGWMYILSIGILLTIFMGETYYSGSLSYYYTHSLGLPIRMQAIAWTVFVAISIVTGIVSSIIADRFVGHKSGRRVPFVRVCGSLLGIIFAFAFTVQLFGKSETGLAINYVLMLSLLFACETALLNAQLAIPSEEIIDKGKRSEAYIMTGIASGLGLVIYFLVSTLQESEQITSEQFGYIMAGIGVAVSIFFFISSFALPHTFVQDAQIVKQSHPVKSFLECLKNKTFLIGEIYLTAIVCSTSINMIGFFYWIGEVIIDYNYIIFLGLPAGAVCAWLFYRWGNGRIPSRFLYGVPAIAAAIALLICAAFGNVTIAPFVGFFGGGIEAFIQYSFNNMIIAEAVDEDALRTGIRKEAQYLELDYIFDSIGSLFQPLFSVIILAYGYIEGMETGMQSAQARQGILIATFVLPAVIIIVGTLLMMFFYPKEK